MRSLCALLISAVMFATRLFAADAFVFVSNGQTITNGRPVSVKALRARYSGSYFWFSTGEKSYLVRDAKVLKRIKAIYAPVFSADPASIDEVNRDIERQLHDLSRQLIAQRVAVEVSK